MPVGSSRGIIAAPGQLPKAFRRRGLAPVAALLCSVVREHKIEIRRRNVEKTLLAAEKVFANKGYGGTAMGRTGGQAHVGDIRRQSDDYRQRESGLAPAGDHLHVFRHLADRRGHAALGHDAILLAELGPAGMIFVPCEGGISHNEIDNADPADLAAGCAVLLRAMLAVSVALAEGKLAA
ncbi:hypothetical protein SAMN05216600_103114 [Pseudomonas cuatrocienegasensis]|uniref:N-carbamoyl-L-amino-acid hydrolase n=1 Tax=Pseudomonas cuatrocienegasensis TaxID=543360 RepID=A0ABY1B693_9PSED|nr:hypothetical protein SAMN05216600_103114 [Pseudomonas cuatrocienegasensis]